jgi:hypothetical protein
MIVSDDGIHLLPMDDDATAGTDQKKKVGKSISAKNG